MAVDILEPVKAETQEAVDRFLRQIFDDLGYRTVVIKPAFDHYGDQILRLTLEFDYRERPIDSRRFVGLTKVIIDVLLANGEHRFPHPSFVFDERQRIMAA